MGNSARKFRVIVSLSLAPPATVALRISHLKMFKLGLPTPVLWT